MAPVISLKLDGGGRGDSSLASQERATCWVHSQLRESLCGLTLGLALSSTVSASQVMGLQASTPCLPPYKLHSELLSLVPFGRQKIRDKASHQLLPPNVFQQQMKKDMYFWLSSSFVQQTKIIRAFKNYIRCIFILSVWMFFSHLHICIPLVCLVPSRVRRFRIA